MCVYDDDCESDSMPSLVWKFNEHFYDRLKILNVQPKGVHIFVPIVNIIASTADLSTNLLFVKY